MIVIVPDVHTRLVSLSANQSHLAANLTSLSTKVDQFSIQVCKSSRESVNTIFVYLNVSWQKLSTYSDTIMTLFFRSAKAKRASNISSFNYSHGCSNGQISLKPGYDRLLLAKLPVVIFTNLADLLLSKNLTHIQAVYTNKRPWKALPFPQN